MMGSQIYVDVPEEKKRMFKTKLAEKDHTQKDVIRAAVDDYLACGGSPSWLNKGSGRKGGN